MTEVKRRRREYWAGLGAVLAALVVLAFGSWPVPQTIDGSVLEALVHDRVVLGVLRLTILVAALYAIASVPALIAGGRWAKGVGSGGFLADDAHVQIPRSSRRSSASLRLSDSTTDASSRSATICFH